MAKRIEFTVLGSPQALKRHRTFRRGNFIGQYDPSMKDKDNFLRTVQDKAPPEPFAGIIKLHIEFLMPRPQAHYRTGKHKGELKDNAPLCHTKKPDLSNLVKFIEDSLDGVFWRDDSQIYLCQAVKVYSGKPRTEIIIEEL